MPSRKVKNPLKPLRSPLSEEELDAIACAKMDQRLRTEKSITLDELRKKYGWPRPRAVAR